MRTTRPQFGPNLRRPFTERPGNTPSPSLYRFTIPQTEPLPADPCARDAKLARLEAALFLADEPLTPRRLAEVAALTDAAEARRMIEKLRLLYDADHTAFQVEEVAGGHQLFTRVTFHPWLLRLRRTGHDLRLTPAAQETLAVIAYKQPITRAEVENVRGVAVAEVIRVLMEKSLVRISGRHQSLGRPQQYGTTKKFLQAFGLNSLDDLPEVAALNTRK